MTIIKKFNWFYKTLAFFVFLPFYLFQITRGIPRAYKKYIKNVELDWQVTQVLNMIRRACISDTEYKFVTKNIMDDLGAGKTAEDAIRSAINLIKSRSEFRASIEPKAVE